jgi:NAD(P)H-dependent flavin oxidoreductase YrpB (nitropropane dioxygenase family)
MATLVTPLTKLLGIKHPVILAGMSGVSHAELVAAVSKAGGLGVVGGLMMQPHVLRELIHEVKAEGVTKFGVDLALPQVGGTARKTNHDYTHGKLNELVDVIIEEGACLFVSAVGAPPKWVVDRLHGAGIPVMNMCGAPRHIEKALEVGCDIMCAQGTEGGGHTGSISTAVLLPQILDKVRGHKSRLTGEPIQVVAAGGIYDGRGLVRKHHHKQSGHRHPVCRPPSFHLPIHPPTDVRHPRIHP